LTTAAYRCFSVAKGISPSMYRTRFGCGARQRRNSPPAATACATPSINQVIAEAARREHHRQALRGQPRRQNQ